MAKNLTKTVIMIPTYNESGNMIPLLEKIMALQVPGHDIHVLVVDDNSPDGTPKLVEDFKKSHPRVELLLRIGRRGRGTAGIEGFQTALKNGADNVIEMDADFSHDPKYLPDLIRAADAGADLVIGSRFVQGGADEDRGPSRRILTQCAGFYIRTILGLQIRDVSSGYRLFKRKVLDAIALGTVRANGPAVVLEMLYRTVIKGFKVTEVPIVFIDRRVGVTKLDKKVLAEALKTVVEMRIRQQKGRLFDRSATP